MNIKSTISPWKILAIIVLALISFRWFWMIDNYAVNLLFWDQWGFYAEFFEKGSYWDIFSHQHGPHRQGIGFILAKWIADLSAWDGKIEAFDWSIAISFWLILSTLKKAIDRKFGFYGYSAFCFNP